MKSKSWISVAVEVIMTEKQMNDYLLQIDEVIKNGKYKDEWESLAEYPVAKWYKEAKFGIFIH